MYNNYDLLYIPHVSMEINNTNVIQTVMSLPFYILLGQAVETDPLVEDILSSIDKIAMSKTVVSIESLSSMRNILITTYPYNGRVDSPLCLIDLALIRVLIIHVKQRGTSDKWSINFLTMQVFIKSANNRSEFPNDLIPKLVQYLNLESEKEDIRLTGRSQKTRSLARYLFVAGHAPM